MKFLSTFSAGAWTPRPWNLGTQAAAVTAKLRELAPYALMELVLPGGSVMALLLWLYRRHKKVPLFATGEILSFL
jgi:hypothetical protein